MVSNNEEGVDMDVKCPQHDLLLATEETVLRIGDTIHSCVIGICPQCNIRYIDRQFFPLSSTFHTNGVTYQYLRRMTRTSKRAQREALCTAEIQRRKSELSEEKRSARELAIIETKSRILSGVYKVYRAKEVQFVKKIPVLCPKDGDELLEVKNTIFHIHGMDVKALAHCCIRCGTAYLLEKRQSEFTKKVASKESPKSSPNSDTILPTPIMPAHLPYSVILSATIRKVDTKNSETITIVSSIEEQDSKRGIYWVGRSKAAAILYAIQTNFTNCRFEHKGINYEVISYKGSHNLAKYLRIISRFCDPAAPQTVHIFAHKNISRFQVEDYEAVTAMIPCADKAFPVATTVYYEKKTSRYFINEETYKSLRNRHGLPHLRLRSAADVVSFGTGFATLKPNSELNLLGYNVNATEGLTTAERRKKLQDIIDTGALKKVEVMNHIEWCIKSHKNIPNHENAVSKWREDLAFISKYKANAQRIVWIKNIQSRFSGSKPL